MNKTPKIEEKKDEFVLKIEEQQKTIEEYTQTLKRLQADFENYMKRVEKEKEQLSAYSNHKLISKLLIVVDDVEKALEIVKTKDAEIAKGIELIHKNFHKLLQEEGVSPIKAVGNNLDPYKHEVLDVVEGEKDDEVVDELQKGYMIKDKVLRPSKVRISKTKGEKK